MSPDDLLAANAMARAVENEEEKRKAALVIADHATDVDDARHLLEVMGLMRGSE